MCLISIKYASGNIISDVHEISNLVHHIFIIKIYNILCWISSSQPTVSTAEVLVITSVLFVLKNLKVLYPNAMFVENCLVDILHIRIVTKMVLKKCL